MKKRVLVVENDSSILNMIELILIDAGYDVFLSASEQFVRQQILSHRPDAILLDIIRPTLEGTALCKEIKNNEDTKHIPVIVLSTHPKIQSVKDICADEVVEKPFDIDQLLAVLEGQI